MLYSSKGGETMVDICFSDSVGGLLFEVKNIIKSDAILPLDLHLNYGHLDGDIVEKQTKRNVDTLKYFYKTVTEKELQKEYKKELKRANKAQETLRKFLSDGQEIRLWLSNNANDRCGLYWFCNLVKDFENSISMVSCPGYEYDDIKNKTRENRNWASFSNPYFMSEFVKNPRVLNKNEILAYSQTWEYIIKENAPFRILIDDSIVGVKEDFFDNAILSFVSREPKSQSFVMGKTLGKWQGGCDVAFISERIEHLIEIGKIKVCEEKTDDNDCYWPRTLSLT